MQEGAGVCVCVCVHAYCVIWEQRMGDATFPYFLLFQISNFPSMPAANESRRYSASLREDKECSA